MRRAFAIRTALAFLFATLDALPTSAAGALQPQEDPEAAPIVEIAPSRPSTPVNPETDALERYLQESELYSVLAAELRTRLNAAPPDQRPAIADRLGQLYVQLLQQAEVPAERQRLEALSRELLERVPDSESFELRINLAKATYLEAEVLAEKQRLRIASKEEAIEAERVLRSVLPQFQELGSRVLAKIQSLERREASVRAGEERALQDKLSEARRVRSLAMYYSGWSGYYLAVVTGESRFAVRASIDFGVLLGSPSGKEASVDRLSTPLLKYEHVARAALGAAMCDSLRGAHVDALRWLDALQAAADLPKPVRDQLFSRRMSVLAAAGRWSELESLVRNARRPERENGPIRPLAVQDARLLAVAALEARQSGKGVLPREVSITESLARAALEDLIEAGEAGHVLNLVTRYGSTPIGGDGFIVQYVRGLQAYDRAREAHRASVQPASSASPATPDADEPATDVAVRNRYQEAAASLKLAVEAEDASKFKDAVGVAWLRYGLSLYYAGDFSRAADVLIKALDATLTADQRREILWLGVVALDKAIDAGQLSRLAERDHLAETYIGLYPDSENAAKLVLLQAARGTRSDDESLARLTNIPPTSALYSAAQQQAANILFNMYRKAPASQKKAAAMRFAELALRVLERDAQRARGQRSEQTTRAAEQAVIRGRQLADALLNTLPQDADRASTTLDLVESVAAERGMDLGAVAEELSFRRLQIALARSNQAEIARRTAELRNSSGPFAQAAELAIFQNASERWQREPTNSEMGREVVRAGTRLLTLRGDNANLGSSLASVRATAADAAAQIGLRENDQDLLRTARELDDQSIADGLKSRSVLKRSGQVREALGDDIGALESWYSLYNALDSKDLLWGEARYESLRLLAKIDPADAAAKLKEHAVLYPTFAPEPWGTKLKDLAAGLGVATPAGVTGVSGATQPQAPALPMPRRGAGAGGN